jgi:hypothetical protein
MYIEDRPYRSSKVQISGVSKPKKKTKPSGLQVPEHWSTKLIKGVRWLVSNSIIQGKEATREGS